MMFPTVVPCMIPKQPNLYEADTNPFVPIRCFRSANVHSSHTQTQHTPPTKRSPFY